MTKDAKKKTSRRASEKSVPLDDGVKIKLAKIAEVYGKGKAKRLRIFYNIWSTPVQRGKKITLKKSEEMELADHDLINCQTDRAGVIGNATACAEFIAKNFGYPCTRNDISKWKKGRGLPPTAKRPFPTGDSAGRFNKSEVEAWIKDVVKEAVEKTEGEKPIFAPDPLQRKAEAAAITAEVESRRALREEDARWMMKEDCRATVIEAIIKHHQMFKTPLQSLPDLIFKRLDAKDFSNEQMTKIRIASAEAGIDIIKLAEDGCEKYEG